MEAVAAVQIAESTVPFYMEDEDEEEEARRQRISEPEPAQPQQSKGKKPTKKAIVKCPQCKTNFFTIDGYLRHKMSHALAGIILVECEMNL